MKIIRNLWPHLLHKNRKETKVWKISAHLLWFGVWRNSGMFNSFDGSAELDQHWTGHADGYEGYTACDWALLCLPVVMDQLPEVYLGSASDQRRAEAWRCSNLPDVVYWIFFGTLWVTLWEIIIKLLVQLRNFPFTTKSYFYTFATFSTFRKNMTNYHKVKKSEYFLKNLYFHVINTFIEMCFNRPISCSKKVL